MTSTTIKSGTGVERFEVICVTGSASAKAANIPPLTDSLINNATFTSGATNGTGLHLREGSARMYSNTYTDIRGQCWLLSSAIDCSADGALIFAHPQSPSWPKLENLSTTKGMGMFYNSSSSGLEESSFFVIGGGTGIGTGDLNTDWQVMVFDPSLTTGANNYDDGTGGRGTFDDSDITHVGIMFDLIGAGAVMSFSSFGKLTPVVAIGGTTTAGDFSVIADHFFDNVTLLHTAPVVGTNICWFSFVIGDGSTATEMTITGQAFSFGSAVDRTAHIKGAHISVDTFGHRVNASASDVIDMSLSTFSGATSIHFTLNGSSSATVIYTGCSVSNAGVFEIDDGMSIVGGLFDDCVPCVCSQPTVSAGATFSNAKTDALQTDSTDFDANITGMTVSDNPVGIIINDTGGNCDLDVTNITFSGNTLDVEYTGPDVLTINVPSGSITSSATGAGSIVITAPVNTFTLNSSESSSLIQIFTTTTQTVLSSATGTVDTYVHSDETVDYVVQKAGFLPQRVVGFVLSGDQTVTVTLDADPVYDSAHGLTYTTDATYDPSVPELILATRQEGRDFYSLMIDSMIAQSTLFNKPFLFTAVGPDSIFFTDDNEIASGDLDNWKGAGIRYVTTAGATAAEWISLKSSGDNTTGVTGEFQQSDGGDQSDARATGNFDQIVAVYGDSTHGTFDFRDHLVCKFQPNPYLEARVDVLDSFGITALEPFEYVVAMTPTLLGVAAGDPAITLTVVDHTSVPLVVGGKSFDYEIQGGGSDSGTAILREWNYNKSLDATMYLKDPFDWCDAVREAGSSFETAYGNVEGSPTGLHGFYVSRSGADHPDFVQFQSNDGTYYVPAVTANISGSGMPTAGGSIRLQISNNTAKTASAWAATTAATLADKVLRSTGLGAESTAGLYFVATTAGTTAGSEPTWDTTVGNTTADGTVVWTTYAILYSDADPASASYSGSYTEGEEFAAGDTAGIRFTELNGTTSFKSYETTTITASTGFSFAVVAVADTVYATNAVDGSAVTQFTADFTNNEVDLSADADFTAADAYAFFDFTLTTSQGMYSFWDGVVAPDVGNYKIVTATLSLKFDNTTTGSVVQTDSARIYRDDGVYPVKDPTTSGYGVQVNWQLPVYSFDGGGGGFTSGDRATLDAVPNAAANAAGLISTDLEDGETVGENLRLKRAATVGDVEDDAGTQIFKGKDGSTERFKSDPVLDGTDVVGRTVTSVNGA